MCLWPASGKAVYLVKKNLKGISSSFTAAAGENVTTRENRVEQI
jgi:hypothetical protein